MNWKNIIDKLPSAHEYWWTLAWLSIFGRTLMINSSLLSKIWFIAMHTPASTSVIADLNKQVLQLGKGLPVKVLADFFSCFWCR